MEYFSGSHTTASLDECDKTPEHTVCPPFQTACPFEHSVRIEGDALIRLAPASLTRLSFTPTMAAPVPFSLNVKFCQGCHVNEFNARLMTCAKCRSVRYCVSTLQLAQTRQPTETDAFSQSPACQKKHWPTHKHICAGKGAIQLPDNEYTTKEAVARSLDLQDRMKEWLKVRHTGL